MLSRRTLQPQFPKQRMIKMKVYVVTNADHLHIYKRKIFAVARVKAIQAEEYPQFTWEIEEFNNRTDYLGTWMYTEGELAEENITIFKKTVIE